MYLKYHRKKGPPFNKRMELRNQKKNFHSFTDKNLKFILGGKFYYYNSNNSKSVFFDKNPKKQLNNLLKEYNLENFINNVEGEYWGVKIDYKNESLTIFTDKLKQFDLYYFYNDNICIVSDDPKKIIDKVGPLEYETNSLISLILFYVPKGHSLFKGLYRLKYNEIITLKKDKILKENLEDKNIKILKYSKNDLLEYKKIIRNAVLSRASNKLNLVLSSGGWDSTIILAILKEHYGRTKVRGIVWKVIMSDGRCYNQFEIDKVKKIAKTLGVKMDVVEIDYRKKNLYCQSKKMEKDLFFQNLFFLAPANWSNLVSYIKKKYGKGVVIFEGEGCDSLHNYGFSQFTSLPHDDKNFQIYADKMKNYLFSPGFFKKVKNNTFFEDAVYKIFLSFNKNKKFINTRKFDLNKRIYYYLFSFMFSDIRIPFRKVDFEKYVKDPAFKNFEKWIKREYFQKVIENIDENNLYYYFSYLYMNFHLQSPELKIFRYGFENMRFPFVDLNLFKFLYKMPQDFGRGLEFRPAKFPLKELAKETLSKEQIEIIESFPHSYLDEIEDFNIWDEYFLKGSWYEYMKDKIDERKVRDIFNENLFHINKIENLIRGFKQGKIKNISPVEGELLIFLTLLSICSKT